MTDKTNPDITEKSFLEDNCDMDTVSQANNTGFGKKSAIMMSVLFCFLLIAVGLLHYIMPDSEYSNSENRVLAAAPALNIESIKDGSFMKDFETYLTDQFPFRDYIVSAKTLADRLLGKDEENGVYIGDDDFLFDSQTPWNEEKAAEITKSISAFYKKNRFSHAAVIIAPNSTYVYSDYLPRYLETESQSEMLKSINASLSKSKISVFDSCKLMLSKKDSSLLYYKTDHHWTTRGAYVMFKALAGEWKLETDKQKYHFYTVGNSFEGTLASKAGVHSYKDAVEICIPEKTKGSYTVEYESQHKKTATLFDENKLSQKNQYEVFLGGNFDKVNISVATQSKNTLLIIKDSYANCFIPMLTPYFNKIVVIDPRYLTDSLDKIVKENSFTHVLFLYNMNTLLEDSSLVPCLES